MLSFFPRGVLDEILNLIESVSEGFPSYSTCIKLLMGITEKNFPVANGGLYTPKIATIHFFLLKTFLSDKVHTKSHIHHYKNLEIICY